MATCPSCGNELQGRYCNICGARAPEGRPPVKKKAETQPGAQVASPVRSPGLLSPKRTWRTVGVAVLALALYGAGVFSGIYIAQDGTGADASAAASGSAGDPDLSAMPALARANYYMEKGVSLMKEGQRAAAVSEFRKSLKEWEAALREEPDNLYAQTYQGLTYYYAGDYQRAVEILRAVLDKDPNYLWAIFNLAWVYETGGMKTEAIMMYRKYLAVAPDEKENLLKYAEQPELIDRQMQAAQEAVERLQGGGSGQ